MMDDYIVLSDEEMAELSYRTHNLMEVLQDYYQGLGGEYENEALDLSRLLMVSCMVSMIHQVYSAVPEEHHERLKYLLDFTGSNVIN